MPLDVVLGPTRAAVFAAACVALTAGGHSLVEGQPIGAAALWMGFGAVFLAALAATRRERSQGAILAAVFTGQAVLHVLFTSRTPTTPPVAMTGMGPGQAMPGMTMTGMTMTAMSPAGPGTLGHSGLGMLSVHLGAGVVVAWWLRRGEVACWRLVRGSEKVAATVRAVLRWVTRAATPRCGRTTLVPIAGSREPGHAMTTALARCLPRRGPPIAVSARQHRAESSRRSTP